MVHYKDTFLTVSSDIIDFVIKSKMAAMEAILNVRNHIFPSLNDISGKFVPIPGTHSSGVINFVIVSKMSARVLFVVISFIM